MPVKLCLSHVESRGEHINIYHSIKCSIDQHILILLFGVLEDTGEIMLRAREGELIRSSLEHCDNTVHVILCYFRNSDRREVTFYNMTCYKILHSEEFVIVSSRVHSIDYPSYKVIHTGPAEKSSLELIPANRLLILLLVVHNVESASYIRLFLLEYCCSSVIRIILERLCYINKNLLNSFTEFHNTLLEASPGVSVHLGCREHSAYTIDQSAEEFVLKLGHIHYNGSYSLNAISVGCRNRNIISIVLRGAVSNSVQNIN